MINLRYGTTMEPVPTSALLAKAQGEMPKADTTCPCQVEICAALKWITYRWATPPEAQPDA